VLVALILVLLPLAIYKQLFQQRTDVPSAQAAAPLQIVDGVTAAAPAPHEPTPTAVVASAAPAPASSSAAAAVRSAAPPVGGVQMEIVPPPAGGVVVIGDLRVDRQVMVDLGPGTHSADVLYRDGRTLRCSFEAQHGGIVRLVPNSPGGPALNVTGEPGPPCEAVGGR
jgi:hypothetical protein